MAQGVYELLVLVLVPTLRPILSVYSTPSPMSSAYAIVQELLDSRQQTAVGIGHFLKALLNLAKPPAKMPIIVQHMDNQGATKLMVFSRQKLSTNFSFSFSCQWHSLQRDADSEQNAMDTLKQDLGIVQRGYSSYGVNVTITGVLFYNEDGTVQTDQLLVSQESWADLMPHVHKIFIRSTKTS